MQFTVIYPEFHLPFSYFISLFYKVFLSFFLIKLYLHLLNNRQNLEILIYFTLFSKSETLVGSIEDHLPL